MMNDMDKRVREMRIGEAKSLKSGVARLNLQETAAGLGKQIQLYEECLEARRAAMKLAGERGEQAAFHEISIKVLKDRLAELLVGDA